MSLLNAQNLLLLMTMLGFLLGVGTFIAGVLTLTLRSASSDVKTLADQTARLASKSLVDDMSGLVGNASNLLGAMNQLVLTTRGIGIFLTLLGLVMMAGASWMAIWAAS
ncbi:MAG: hypothetical protein AB1894_12435 [Chloroflexota bacterium]